MKINQKARSKIKESVIYNKVILDTLLYVIFIGVEYTKFKDFIGGMDVPLY